MVGGNNNSRQYNDKTSTKIFVGGLAWETQRDTMRRYFEQFGEILEAVVITDKNSGKSKGYGFVTFKNPEAAMKACQNSSPIIDGRRTNCSIASIGANKNRIKASHHGRFRAAPGMLASPAYHVSDSTFVHPNSGYTHFLGYTGYSQDTMYPMNFYGVFGGQQFSTYCPSNGASGPMGLVHNIYPFSVQYPYINNQAQGFGVQYPQIMHFPIFPRHYGSTGIPTFPSSVAMPTIGAVTTTATTTTTEAIETSQGASQTPGTTSELNSSAEFRHR